MLRCLALVASAAGLGLALLSCPCEAQNLVANPGFQASLSSWTVNSLPAGFVTWGSLDASWSPTSGSADFINYRPCTQTGPGSYSCEAPRLGQCIDVSPATRYRAGYSGFTGVGPDSFGFFTLTLGYFTGPGCSGTAVSGPAFSLRPEGISWVRRTDRLTTPPEARSLLLSLSAYHDAVPAGSFSGYVDDVTLEALAPDPSPVEISRGALFAAAFLLILVGLSQLRS